MIRPLTALASLVFVGAGFYVFQTKEQVVSLERELRVVHRETEEERQRTRLLNAEWARLNDQERLRNLANTHLREMHPMEPSQFVRFEDATRRMPAPVAFAAPPGGGFRQRADAPSAPGEVLVFNMASLQAIARAAEEPRQAAPRPAAVQPVVAVGTPPVLSPLPPPPGTRAPASAPVDAARPATRPAPQPAAPVALAAATPAGQTATPPGSGTPARARSEAPALPPIAGPAVAAAPSPPRVAAATPPANVRPAMHVQPAPPPPPIAGSLLGGGSALPPPVPFSR